MARGVIRSQWDLDKMMQHEKNMYYISLSGNIATFNGKYSMTLIMANERLVEIARGQSEMITECMAKGQRGDAEEAVAICLQTYLIPYRIH